MVFTRSFSTPTRNDEQIARQRQNEETYKALSRHRRNIAPTSPSSREEQYTTRTNKRRKGWGTKRKNKTQSLQSQILNTNDATYIRPTPSQIANHKRLLRSVPYIYREAFRHECAKHFNDYSSFSHQNNTTGMVNSIVKILRTPTQMLIRMRGGRKLRRMQQSQKRINNNNSYLNRITQEEAIEKEIQLHEQSLTAEQQKIIHLKLQSINENTTHDDIKKIHKAMELIEHQHISKATKVLNQPCSNLDTTSQANIIEQLKKLHPQNKGFDSESIPIMPTNNYLVTINLNDSKENKSFCKFIKKMNNGSAPGISGWTGDMLVTLIANKDCKYGLAQLICDIINGKIPEEAKDYLLGSHLIPIPKPDGRIRPISIGEIFYRTAASYAITQVKEEIGSILAPIQLGVGVPAGCEQAIHKLQHLLTRNKPTRLAGISVDFRNAFNERNRNHIIKCLYNEPKLKPLWNIATWSYNSSSLLWVEDKQNKCLTQVDHLRSTSGVKQGDPLGSLLFALSMREIYQESIKLDTTNSITAVAIQDDITLIGPPSSHLLQALKNLRNRAKEGGLQMNMSKTKLIWLHTDKDIEEEMDDTLIDAFKDEGIGIERGAMKLLGAVIGTDINEMKKIAEDIIIQHQLFFDRILSSHMCLQHGMILLRQCALPRINYLARTSSPNSILSAIHTFDEMIKEVLTIKFGIPTYSPESSPPSSASFHINDNINRIRRANKQLELPIKMGGLGLRNASSLIHISYISSLVASIHHDQHWWTDINNRPNHDNNPTLMSITKNSIQQIKKQIRAKDFKLVPTDDDVVSYVSQQSKQVRLEERGRIKDAEVKLTKLQHELSHSMSKVQLIKLFNDIDQEKNTSQHDYDIVRIQLLQQNDLNYMWLYSIPTERSLEISDMNYKLALKYRLGLDWYTDLMKSSCVCLKSQPFQRDPFHALVCNKTRYKGYHIRHNKILEVIALFARRAGIRVEVEARNMNEDDRLKPDLILLTKSQVYIIDVTVIHPFANSNMRRLKTINPNIRKQLRFEEQKEETENEEEEREEEKKEETLEGINDEVQEEEKEEKYNSNPDSESPLMINSRYHNPLRTASQLKRKKYKQIISDHNAEFLTAAVYSNGGLFQDFKLIIDIIRKEANHNSIAWDPQELIDQLKFGVAAEIQNGNADVIIQNRNQVIRNRIHKLNDNSNLVHHRNNNNSSSSPLTPSSSSSSSSSISSSFSSPSSSSSPFSSPSSFSLSSSFSSSIPSSTHTNTSTDIQRETTTQQHRDTESETSEQHSHPHSHTDAQ